MGLLPENVRYILRVVEEESLDKHAEIADRIMENHTHATVMETSSKKDDEKHLLGETSAITDRLKNLEKCMTDMAAAIERLSKQQRDSRPSRPRSHHHQ